MREFPESTKPSAKRRCDCLAEITSTLVGRGGKGVSRAPGPSASSSCHCPLSSGPEGVLLPTHAHDLAASCPGTEPAKRTRA